MPLPKAIREQVKPIITDYCANRVPEHARDQVKMAFEIRGNSITLYEERPHWQHPEQWMKLSIAQFRYDQVMERWILYCTDRNSRWHSYPAKPVSDIRIHLREIDADPTHIFWG